MVVYEAKEATLQMIHYDEPFYWSQQMIKIKNLVINIPKRRGRPKKKILVPMTFLVEVELK